MGGAALAVHRAGQKAKAALTKAFCKCMARVAGGPGDPVANLSGRPVSRTTGPGPASPLDQCEPEVVSISAWWALPSPWRPTA